MKAMNGMIRYGSQSEFSFATYNNKFPQEKVCFENEDYLIHFDGVILNSSELKDELGCACNQEILLQLYKNYGAELVLHTKGLYTLVLWDKKAQTVLVTNDLLSKRPLYYHRAENALFYAASYYDLLDNLSHEGFAPALNREGFADMLQHGFVTGSKTYLEDVFFLNAFESLVVDLNENQTRVVQHPMKDYQIPDSEDDAIAMFDKLFSTAVGLQYRKNEEYGYTQCVTLSGGMDSRACLLQAKDLGLVKNAVCFNYAQSGSLDFSISQQIAADLGLDYIHYPMDAAVFVGRLQEAMNGNECMQSGIGATGARTMANLLNTSNFGLINIGICGGELMGDLVIKNIENEHKNRLVRVASRVINKIKNQIFPSVPSAKDFLFNRDEYLNHLRASKNFAGMFIDKCECISPFMDEDVAMFVLQLNPGLLYDRRFYRKWMIKHLPNSYIITSTCTTIDGTLLQEVVAKVKYRYLLRRNGVDLWNMNPIQHWLEAYPHHAQNCTAEYEQNCQWLAENGCEEELLSAFRQGWCGEWVPKLYTLTAQRAAKDILSRFKKNA